VNPPLEKKGDSSFPTPKDGASNNFKDVTGDAELFKMALLQINNIF
jgi:hypothetical protein